MRDLALTAFVFGALPFILWRPHIGVLMWTWLSIMNPHRLTWSFAYDMQFAFIVAVVTLISLLVSREPKKMPWTAETVVLLLFIAWMMLTTLFAMYPHDAWTHLQKVLKILLMVFVTMVLMQSKERINLLVWVMTLSLAFYGIKGGLFTLRGGGIHNVQGPPGSFITGNNEMALALIMTIPLLRYLQMTASKIWIRHGMTAAMLLTALAAIGSHSRGALVGMLAVGGVFWLKSRGKLFSGALVVIAAMTVLAIMPERWFERMGTIVNYQQDGSALRRINAWMVAINIAVDRPLGGGFEVFQPRTFAAYAPQSLRYADAHSIYFEVLGEHGFVGLALFLALGLVAWRSASWIIRRARGDPQNAWAGDLARMVQVSIVGYASAGAFLGLAYFDLYYTLVAVVVLCKMVLMKQDAEALLARKAQAGANADLPVAPAPAR
ncbi:MAG TPA: putative O-glycosylation ligase, exosortase A system-associated [Burkholderiales bacterium]|nr:putative O-glycosylation ligase, exosortase A system-associated [Burkholderiales bacterium]